MSSAIMWSGGKDSTATIILAHEHGIPVDYILMSEVMFDISRNISGENPEHIKWVNEIAIPRIESWGYKVKKVRAEKDYLQIFYRKKKRSKNPSANGKYYGFPILGLCWGNGELKIEPLRKAERELNVTEKIVGIAIDEPERLERALRKGQRSLLAEYGYTEQMALELCKKYDLLSPTYAYSFRGGCWFCPNASVKEFAHLKTHHPELWGELQKLTDYIRKHKEFFYKYTFKGNETIEDIDRKVDLYIKSKKKEIGLFED